MLDPGFDEIGAAAVLSKAGARTKRGSAAVPAASPATRRRSRRLSRYPGNFSLPAGRIEGSRVRSRLRRTNLPLEYQRERRARVAGDPNAEADQDPGAGRLCRVLTNERATAHPHLRIVHFSRNCGIE